MAINSLRLVTSLICLYADDGHPQDVKSDVRVAAVYGFISDVSLSFTPPTQHLSKQKYVISFGKTRIGQEIEKI